MYTKLQGYLATSIVERKALSQVSDQIEADLPLWSTQNLNKCEKEIWIYWKESEFDYQNITFIIAATRELWKTQKGGTFLKAGDEGPPRPRQGPGAEPPVGGTSVL